MAYRIFQLHCKFVGTVTWPATKYSGHACACAGEVLRNRLDLNGCLPQVKDLLSSNFRDYCFVCSCLLFLTFIYFVMESFKLSYQWKRFDLSFLCLSWIKKSNSFIKSIEISGY